MILLLLTPTNGEPVAAPARLVSAKLAGAPRMSGALAGASRIFARLKGGD
jgi:hypothetical protein